MLPGQTVTVRLRLRAAGHADVPFSEAYAETLRLRKAEADRFYAGVTPAGTSPDDAHIARRAFAGLLWGKQIYRYTVADWLEGDPTQPPPPDRRKALQPWARNTDWKHLELADVISMPDEWEYPWFATWDLAFHAVTLAHVDPALAKDQLLLLCREWAQHPSGQLSLLRITEELARNYPAWSELPTTFLERFLSIAEATEAFGSTDAHLWDETDGFYYDRLLGTDDPGEPVRVRSFVGLVPLFAVAITPAWVVRDLPGYMQRRDWLEANRRDLLTARIVTHVEDERDGALALVPPDRYARVLARVLDEQEFLSPHGIRSLSAVYRDQWTMRVGGHDLPIRYCPAESDSGLFGGNSNWRGPIWLPVNALLVDAIRTYAIGAGREIEVELPTGSGRRVDLHAVADDLTERLIGMFRPDATGRRPSQPTDHPDSPLWNAHPTFSEYFDGDSGVGLGASHQTGWSALVAHLICSRGR